MEARLSRAVLIAASLLSLGAGYRTQNFIVTAPTANFAREVAVSAENYRRDLAIEWLGEELPPWSDPCPISVQVGPQLGAGGATSFTFIGGRPSGWTMSIQGSAERILDSVLPHEVTHTVFATHFGRPLPRWADEGACTTVEHASERDKQHKLLYEFLTTGRGIAFNKMFAMKEYPPDVLPLYSQGYSLARFLIAQGGQRKFIEYVGDGMQWNNWTKATQQHYGFSSLSDLQTTWVNWVRRGCPPIESIADARGTQSSIQLASTAAPRNIPSPPEDRVREEISDAPVGRSDRSTVPVERMASDDRSIPAASGRTQFASTKTSWYARVRDESRGAKLGAPPRAKAASALHQAVSESLSRGNSSQSQVLTRPQPTEQAQQRVIEWSQPASAQTSATARQTVVR